MRPHRGSVGGGAEGVALHHRAYQESTAVLVLSCATANVRAWWRAGCSTTAAAVAAVTAVLRAARTTVMTVTRMMTVMRIGAVTVVPAAAAAVTAAAVAQRVVGQMVVGQMVVAGIAAVRAKRGARVGAQSESAGSAAKVLPRVKVERAVVQRMVRRMR